MAQDGYGLSRGVSGFFDVYFKTKQQRQQQAEAVQKAQLEQRQQNFYEMMQRSQLLQRQQEAGMERNLGIEKNISSLMGDYVPAPEGYTGQAMSGKHIESLYPTSLGGRDVFPDEQQYIRREDLPKQKTETPHFKTDERGVVHEWDEATGEFKPTNLKERLPKEKEETEPELSENWGRIGLTIAAGKNKQTYPYNEAGLSRLTSDILNKDIRLTTYVKKLIRDNKITDSDTLQREIARHTQNKWYKGGKGFSDEEISRLDKLTEMYGQFMQQINQ